MSRPEDRSAPASLCSPLVRPLAFGAKAAAIRVGIVSLADLPGGDSRQLLSQTSQNPDRAKDDSADATIAGHPRATSFGSR
jgi:hypothetical protein